MRHGDRGTYRVVEFRGGDVLVLAGGVGGRHSRAVGTGKMETMEAGLASRRLAGRDCARRLRRRWRTRLDDRTGVRSPPARRSRCFTRRRRVRQAPPPRRPKGRRYVPSTAGRLRSRAAPPPWPGSAPAGGGTAARARRTGESTYQLVNLAIGDASSMTSTSWRDSLSKARHIATSSQESQGPCSSPVASSTTVYRGGWMGIPLCSPEEYQERLAHGSHRAERPAG